MKRLRSGNALRASTTLRSIQRKSPALGGTFLAYGAQWRKRPERGNAPTGAAGANSA